MTPRAPSGLSSSPQPMTISVGEPRPLLDEGDVLARCTDATCAWSRRWKKWIVRLVMEPLDYDGRPYTGSLCKFLSLGTNPKKPHAGQQSQFRRLWVEVNGAQPTGTDVQLGIFVGHLFKVAVATVKKDRNDEAVAPAHWYSIVREISFCRAEVRPLERANLPTLKHGNTATRQPFNPLTLNTQQHRQHNNTPAASSSGKSVGLSTKRHKGQDSDSSVGSVQQTYNANPDNGAGAKASAPYGQNKETCYVHGVTAWWRRADGGLVCSRCHPGPPNATDEVQ
jgi:hypothetical protein